MSDESPSAAPVFILGCHRSGTSAVTGLLHRAAGLALGELMPAHADNPRGYFESMGVVRAHRDILKQLDRDWTCPPPTFDPNSVDLSQLREQLAEHQALEEPWGVKDPRLMFMLEAWAAIGLENVRFVGVLRREAEVVRSLTRRDEMGQIDAENIVQAHLRRMETIAEQVPLPIVEFSNDQAAVLEQTRRLAHALGLAWDQSAAEEFFEAELVRNRTTFSDYSDAYQRLIQQSKLDDDVPVAHLAELRFDSERPVPLNTHVGPRNGGRRNELWSAVRFDLAADPAVVELIPAGARQGRTARPTVSLDVAQLDHPLHVGSVLNRFPLPNGVVASGVLDTVSPADLDTFLREVYLFTAPLTEAAFDLLFPDNGSPSSDAGTLDIATFRTVASDAGWDVVFDQRISPQRVAVKIRKRILTDSQLIPVVTELLAASDRLKNIDSVVKREVSRQLARTDNEAQGAKRAPSEESSGLLERAEKAERDLERLRSRRSVRMALFVSRPFAGLFRFVRRRRR